MNYIDLFAGAGGFSIGFKNAGFNLLYANEFDAHACNTYRNNLVKLGEDPNKMIEGPIEDLYKLINKKKISLTNKENIHENSNVKLSYKRSKKILEDNVHVDLQNKNVDLIIGGPPCQGFSNAGRAKKPSTMREALDFVDDPRNQLFKYFLGFVDFYNPKVVIIENVKGIKASADYKHLIETSLEQTGKGYVTFSKVLMASNFGVPQHRERIFFIGIRSDIDGGDEFMYYLNNILSYHQESYPTVKEAIEDLPIIVSNPKPKNHELKNEIPIGSKGSFGEMTSSKPYTSLIPKISEYNKRIGLFKGKYIKPRKLFNHKVRYNNEHDLEIYKLIKPGIYLDHPENYEALKLCKYGTREVNGKVIIEGFKDKYFKLHPDKPSRTIVAHLQMDNNGFIHYGDIPRGISVREAARLQSFPDWYEFKGPLSFQFKQIGNAVPPLLAYKLATLMITFLQEGVSSLLDKYAQKELFE